MSRPPRLAGFSYVGLRRYFLTFCTLQRELRFVSDEPVDNALLHIRRTAAEEAYDNVAYCFMPDHVHLLVEARRDAANLCRFVKLAKQRSGAAYALQHGVRLWQEGYYDRVLRNEEDTTAVAKYILENPVRAGLVTSVMDYPYSGSDRWSHAELLTLWD
jgi:REP-associated tyrosine transposase